LFRYRLLLLNGILLLTLLISYRGRNIDDVTFAQPDFLRHIPLHFRDWTASDEHLSVPEQEMLQPDAVLLRTYASHAGDAVELAVIVGHRKRSIHTPGFCMAGGGWETLWQQSQDLMLDGRKIPAIRSLLSKNNQLLLITYFFTNGDYSTRNLIAFQGEQMVKRLRSEVPLGAMVRILTPVRSDQAAAERLSDEFAQATVAPVLQELRQVQLHVK
jgi:EpsI family protein